MKRLWARDREELNSLRALQGMAENRLSARIATLEAKARGLAARTREVERRRAADAEGWQADITALRQRLAAAERRQRRLSVLCSLPDGDRRDTVLARHRALEERERGRFADISSFDSEEDFHVGLEALCAELGALRAALGGLERHLLPSD